MQTENSTKKPSRTSASVAVPGRRGKELVGYKYFWRTEFSDIESCRE